MKSNEISGTTQLYGIFAHPITHSLSPFIHNEAFLACDIDARYLAFDVSSKNFDQAMRSIKVLNIGGVNISMPYKELAIQFMDDVSPAAKAIGAINTVVNRDGLLTGYNTDGVGFARSLEAKKVSLFNQNIVLLGAGGAAKAIAYQACQEQVASITVFKRKNKSFDDTIQYFEKLATNCDVCIRVAAYEDELEMKKVICQSDIVINCTNIGMNKFDNESPVTDTSIFKPSQVIVDLIYQPETTYFLQEASKQGCVTINGLGMLIYQAQEAFYLWTNKRLSPEVIEEKLKRKLYKERSLR